MIVSQHAFRHQYFMR